MKQLALVFAVIFAAVLSAVEAPLYPVKGIAINGVSFVENGDTLAFVFKLPADAPQNFALTNIYLFADDKPDTGRKGMGNEYYFDITKAMISTYTADGKGTLHRNAISQFRSGEWYIITFDT